MAASLLAFAKQALLARSGGDSAFGGAMEVLQHNVQHPSAGSAEGPEPEVLVHVPTLGSLNCISQPHRQIASRHGGQERRPKEAPGSGGAGSTTGCAME